MKILIVVPTYNEEENVGILIKKIKMLEISGMDVLFVDDNSSDRTAEEIKFFQQENPRVFLLERESKLGLGTAYLAGFSWGLKNEYDVMIEMDADLSHDPDYLLSLIEVAKNYDFVIGSRYIPGGGIENWGFFRRKLSFLGSIYARIILGVNIRDFTGGFNVWRADVLRKIGLDSISSNGYSFQIELKFRAVKAGFKYKEVPIVFKERTIGQSKMNLRIVAEALWRIPFLRFPGSVSLAKSRKTKEYPGNV
jgi:dolichol-phosphate mannosyltransferase